MTITLELPADVEAALLADAKAQNRPAETIAAERLAAFYGDESDEPEEEAVEAIAQALADLEAGDRGIPLEDYIAETKARRGQREAAKAAA